MAFAESDGARISYTVDGDAGRPPLLLVMGLGGSSVEWGTDFVQALAAHFQVARFDNRGVGTSETSTYDFTLQDMAADAVAVLDALGWQRAHVLGLSMGGMITQQLALDAADRVAGLVLMSTHFGGAEVVPLTARAKNLFNDLLSGDTSQQYFARVFTVLSAPGFAEEHPELVSRFVEGRSQMRVSSTVFQAQLRALMASDRSRQVNQLRQPTMIVHGKEDCLIPPANGENLAARIPNAKLVLLDGCGHLPPWECPQQVVERLQGFLSEVPL